MGKKKKHNTKKETFSLYTRTLDGSLVKDNIKWLVKASGKSHEASVKNLRQHKAKKGSV